MAGFRLHRPGLRRAVHDSHLHQPGWFCLPDARRAPCPAGSGYDIGRPPRGRSARARAEHAGPARLCDRLMSSPVRRPGSSTERHDRWIPFSRPERAHLELERDARRDRSRPRSVVGPAAPMRGLERLRSVRVISAGTPWPRTCTAATTSSPVIVSRTRSANSPPPSVPQAWQARRRPRGIARDAMCHRRTGRRRRVREERIVGVGSYPVSACCQRCRTDFR